MKSFSTISIREAAMAVLVTLVALGVAEFGTRAVDTLQPQYADPILGTRPVPGAETDKNGFRNRSALATATIVTLGDSFTYGKSVHRDESWPAVLGNLNGASVYNMAVQGYSPLQYAALLRQALTLDPRIVIVGLNIPNDLSETYTFACTNEYWNKICSPDLVERPQETVPGNRSTFESAKKYLLVRSRAFARLGEVTRGLRDVLSDPFRSERIERVVEIDERGIETALKPDHHFARMDLDVRTTNEGWRITRETLATMKEMTEHANARFLVLLIPSVEDVYVLYFERNGKPIPEGLRDYAAMARRTFAAVEEYCAADEIECVSALPSLADDLSEGEQLYRRTNDDHAVARGYATVAHVIDRKLKLGKDSGY